MSERAAHLFQAGDDQISDLIALLDAADDGALHLPCAGREKLGDGSIAAVATHTADNYHRIAEYLDADAQPAVPPASEMRFADGQRTLEQIVVSLPHHQGHQCGALSAALAEPPSGR